MKPDRIDLEILRLLQQDGRLSSQALSAKVKLSARACLDRLRRLEAAGYIRGYTARIDRDKLGASVSVFAQVTLTDQRRATRDRFESRIARCDEVVACYLVSGEYDYLLRIVVKDTRDYERLLREKLYKIKGIRHSQSSFVLRTLKKADLPLGV